MSPGSARFVDAQKAFFREADADHFRWQTQGPYFADTEAELLSEVALDRVERLLEIGCGHGANLLHLRRRLGAGARLFGIDFSAERARFASGAASAACLCADAARLPFCSAAFDAVLIRDLLHHVPDRAAVLAEAARVLVPGGRLTLIEPNGINPLMAAAALAQSAERGMLSSSADRAAREIAAAGFDQLRVSARQPLPLSRLLLHYRLGRPSLGAQPGIARALAAIESLAERLPRALWAYFIVTGTKPAPAGSPK